MKNKIGRPQNTYNEESKKEIKNIYKKSHEKKERSRILVVKLRVIQGMSAKEIATIVDYSCGYVAEIINKYDQFGISALTSKEYCGNHKNMTFEEEQAFLEPFKSKAMAGEILEVSEIIIAYGEKLNKKVSKSTVYKMLHRHEWRKIMPRSEHPKKASDDEIEAYKKNV